MDDHPGGKKVILAYAGRDASEEFNALHSARTRARAPQWPHACVYVPYRCMFSDSASVRVG